MSAFDQADIHSRHSQRPSKVGTMITAFIWGRFFCWSCDRAAAKFIEKTRDLYLDMIYTSVSFVGSTALADELTLLGKKYATGAIVTAGRASSRWPLVVGARLQICTRQILPWRAAGLRVARRLCGRQRVDRGVAAQWLTARHRRTGRDSGKSARHRHWARHARDLQPVRPSGRAQGVGYTARRDRALSTHRLASSKYRSAAGYVDRDGPLKALLFLSLFHGYPRQSPQKSAGASLSQPLSSVEPA